MGSASRMAIMQPPPIAVPRITVPSLAYHGISVRSMVDHRPSPTDVAVAGVEVRQLLSNRGDLVLALLSD